MALALVLAACTPPPARHAAAPALPRNHQPVAKHTGDTGGPMPAEEAALEPRHADLQFRIEPDSQSIQGDATLVFGVKSGLKTMVLDLDPELTIRSVKVDGRAAKFADPDGWLRISPVAPLAAGAQVTVEVVYGGQPHVAKNAPWDDGFVWAKTDKGRPWVASTAEGMGCDLFWPCIDQPTAEFPLVDQHVTVGPGLSAASNGRLLGVRDAGKGWRTFDWRAKHPDTYAVAINVAPYEVLKRDFHSRFGETIPMEFWYLTGHKKEAEKLFDTVPDMVAFLEAKIGPYPFWDEKIGMVETPHKGMEHQTINAYGNGYAIGPWGFDDLLQHEFGHEWFGNQVTNKDWTDMWLHEGFTAYLQPLYSQYLRGEIDYAAYMRSYRLNIRNKAPVASRKSMTGEVVYDDDKGGPGQDIYNKGAWVLHTLRGMIGDKAFFRSLTELAYGRIDPRPGNFAPRYANTDDYVAIVNQVSGRDLTWFFNAYLRVAALPDLQQSREGGMMKLRWKTADGGPFPMPVEVSIDDRITTLPMKDGTGEIAIPDGALVTLDPQQKLLRADPAVDAIIAYRKAHPKGPPKPPAQDFHVTGYPPDKKKGS